MKTLLSFIMLAPVLLFGQKILYPPEAIKVQVKGDTVILSQDSVMRNCGAEYNMKVLIQADTLYWLQDDTGSAFSCDCYFNVSVTVDSVPTGQYTAKVYYSEHSNYYPYLYTVYVGSIQFEVLQQNSFIGYHKTDENQSDCFYVGLDDKRRETAPNILLFPNPTKDIITIILDGNFENQVRIINIQNGYINDFIFDGRVKTIDISEYPQGVYIVTGTSKSGVYIKKFIKI